MIKIENLSYAYSKNDVLSGVDLNLEEGRIYGLLGKNGVGKTTLLKIMAGLLKGKGTIQVQSSIAPEKTTVYVPFRREPGFLEEMFFLPENFAVPEETVLEFARAHGVFYPRFELQKFERFAEMLEIDKNAAFRSMSYGQQKKAMIAFALSLNVSLLLMDEPSNGLDIPSKAQLRMAIAECSTEKNIIIVSTHQVRDLENLIDPVLILDRSGILLHASIEEISSKLTFTTDPQQKEGALYSEPALGSFINVCLNSGSEETQVNIEALFNAVLNHKELFRGLFGKH